MLDTRQNVRDVASVTSRKYSIGPIENCARENIPVFWPGLVVVLTMSEFDQNDENRTLR